MILLRQPPTATCPPLLHVGQELVELAELVKANCARACLVMYPNDVGNGCQAEVEVAQLQCCLQLHGRQLSIAILVYGLKPLAVQTWCGWGHVCQPRQPAEGVQKVPAAGMQEGHCTAACTLTFLN